MAGLSLIGAGYGYGYGYGDGYGGGYGYGDGLLMGHIYGNDVCLIDSFQLIKIGCQIHSVETWKSNWQEIARRNSIEITKEEVSLILSQL